MQTILDFLEIVFYFEFWMSTVNKMGALGTTGVLQNYRRG